MNDADVAEIRHRLRAAEMRYALQWFPPASRVLELGGADGYQASLIQRAGHDVSSIDVTGRAPQERTFHTVRDYDGTHIPFADRTFDVVFSSNVLEHIPRLPDTLADTRRVLRADGISIHLVPSASWRLWTTVAHYPWLFTYAMGMAPSHPGNVAPRMDDAIARSSRLDLIKKTLGLAAHGEYPNALSELYYFRRARWVGFLRQHGFELVHSGGNHLFYTGYVLFANLPIPARRKLARILGSSCHLFVAKIGRGDPW